jgi:hypothetical protein
MFILLINYVISESQRKGTAVLGDGEIFTRLLPEVVATGAGICDKALTRLQNRVAKQFKNLGRFYGLIQNDKGPFHNEPFPINYLKTKLINHNP